MEEWEEDLQSKPPIGTEPLTPATANNSAAAIAIAIAHRLAITSVNSSKSNGGPCLPQLNHFILPLKEARFTVIKQCVTVTGRVVWTNYFNNDGDANFNVVLDPPYKNMLGPGGSWLNHRPDCRKCNAVWCPIYTVKSFMRRNPSVA